MSNLFAQKVTVAALAAEVGAPQTEIGGAWHPLLNTSKK